MATTEPKPESIGKYGRCVIYALIDPRTQYFFYVGVSQRPLTCLEEHIVLALRRKESELNAYISNMLACGFKPGLIELEEIQEGEGRVPQRKKVWVEELGKRGKLLSCD